MTKGKSYVWDSCVFLAWLYSEQQEPGDLESIQQFIDDAQNRRITIYSSALIYAEVAGNIAKKSETKDLKKVIDDIEKTITIVSPNDIIMRTAMYLRSIRYSKDGSESQPGIRQLATIDAIMLATAIYMNDVGETIHEFHTYDKGNSKREGKKTVPLLGFETWCLNPGTLNRAQKEAMDKAVRLARVRPVHSEPKLPLET